MKSVGWGKKTIENQQIGLFGVDSSLECGCDIMMC